MTIEWLSLTSRKVVGGCHGRSSHKSCRRRISSCSSISTPACRPGVAAIRSGSARSITRNFAKFTETGLDLIRCASSRLRRRLAHPRTLRGGRHGHRSHAGTAREDCSSPSQADASTTRNTAARPWARHQQAPCGTHGRRGRRESTLGPSKRNVLHGTAWPRRRKQRNHLPQAHMGPTRPRGRRTSRRRRLPEHAADHYVPRGRSGLRRRRAFPARASAADPYAGRVPRLADA